MKFQNVYESNFDYEATYEALLSTLKGVDITEKGLISFRFKPKNIEVLLSRRGKVQVTWASEEEKQEFMPLLKSFLVPPEGQKLTLNPVEMNIYKVPYPGPSRFSLAWCRQVVTYIRNLGLWNYLKWRTQNYNERLDEALRLVRCEIAIKHEEMYLDGNDPEYFKKLNEIQFKWRKRYGLI